MSVDLRDFPALEAQLLDQKRYDEWLNLFAADGRYWVPLAGVMQADAQQYNSIALEDKLLLQLRITRLKNVRAHSQHPGSHCQHVLQATRIEMHDEPGGEAVLTTPFIYTEVQGAQQVLLSGTYQHTLVRDTRQLEAVWLMREKRVNLLQCAQALPAIQLFI